ncbi:type II secretion system protein N [Reinekea marinisedimentorum]|uniref:Type II secretion system protein N n=1 Tax=Reinekea marinisedimentorum TaxID=230495 RepID=A0A4R3I9L8_9GAMM|nr:type II secretion system protein N [Reinekea marinisedimentorum]TCS42080.1 type II secretion system (T2SS) protein N [Reinekea marinisedimentorum]
MKLVNFKILALLLVSYLLTLVVTAPLNWWLPHLEPQLKSNGIVLQDSAGTIWQGETNARVDRLGQFHVNWKINAFKLLLLQVPVSFHAYNVDMNVQGELSVSPLGISVRELSGYADDSAFASIAKSYKSELKGRLSIQSFAAKIGWNKSLGPAAGRVTWSGGDLVVPVGNSRKTFEVPMMIAVISSDESGWLAAVQGAEKQTYMEAQLAQDGLATLSVKRQLADDMSLPVPGSGASLLDVTQQVF